VTSNGLPSIHAEDLVKTYGNPGSLEAVTALHLPRLSILGGEAVALAGPSGSGKTTLLHILAGLITPTQGTATVNGVNVIALSESERDLFRARNVGYVFQSFNLLPAFSALENVLLALDLAGAVPPAHRRSRAVALLTELGLGPRLKHRPARLSIGEQQRVAVARALVNSPRVILADEPTANVDPATRQVVIGKLLAAARETQAVLLVATHDESLHSQFDRVVRLHPGLQQDRAPGV
jgi:ABC-type lipoprotein export system ATPase subunit